MRKTLTLVLLTSLVGCSVVRHSFVRPDYDEFDKTHTLRLAIVTSPLPLGEENLGLMWSEIARQYVNDKRDFIASEQLASDAMVEDPCAGRIQGVLHLSPELVQKSRGVEVSVQARLFRCPDRETVWTAEGAGSFSSDDKLFTDTRAFYVERFGDEVGPYVAPVFRLLRGVLDTLPYPELTNDDDIMEKIELD